MYQLSFSLTGSYPITPALRPQAERVCLLCECFRGEGSRVFDNTGQVVIAMAVSKGYILTMYNWLEWLLDWFMWTTFANVLFSQEMFSMVAVTK